MDKCSKLSKDMGEYCKISTAVFLAPEGCQLPVISCPRQSNKVHRAFLRVNVQNDQLHEVHGCKAFVSFESTSKCIVYVVFVKYRVLNTMYSHQNCPAASPLLGYNSFTS